MKKAKQLIHKIINPLQERVVWISQVIGTGLIQIRCTFPLMKWVAVAR
jgi:hypothetical protein